MVYNNSYTIYCLLVIIPCLPNTVRSCRRLQIILGIEVTVYKYHSVCRHQIQALATLMENKRLIYKHPYDETQLFLFSLDSAYILCKKTLSQSIMHQFQNFKSKYVILATF